MEFKNFRLQLIIRVALLALSCIAFAFCLAYHYYLRSYYAGAAIVVIVLEMIWFVDRFNRDVGTFMNSILHNDFTIHFEAGADQGKSFHGLYEMLNKISAAFKKISGEKEIQHRYLEMLVANLQVGILSFDSDEKIHVTNTALKNLLRQSAIQEVAGLASIDPSLPIAVRAIRAGQTLLIKIRVGHDLLHLSLHASEFRLENQYFKLISVQNIRTELDAREMEAWQKLIRVMTHEIMNSISPITSLSSSLHALVRESLKEGLEQPLGHTLDQGLDAIRKRSEGLHTFTEAYRKLTRIPAPSVKETNIRDLFTRVTLLLATDISANNIQLKVRSEEIPVMIDPALMEQVIINLVRNAIEALHDQPDPQIQLEYESSGEKSVIRITDNGHGIDPEILENIFVPFFTTKKNGSGIGLALSKQIIHLHRGDIKVESVHAKGTSFIIYL